MSQIQNNGVNGFNFESFLNSVPQGKDDRYVYMKNSGMKTEGGFMHLFTFASTNRNTVRQLQEHIRQTYGDHVGDAVSGMFTNYLDGKHQMKVGVMRNIFKTAQMEYCKNMMATLTKDYGEDVGNILGTQFKSTLNSGTVLDSASLKQEIADAFGGNTEGGLGFDPQSIGSALGSAQEGIHKATDNMRSDMRAPLEQLGNMPGGITKEGLLSVIRETWGEKSINTMMRTMIGRLPQKPAMKDVLTYMNAASLNASSNYIDNLRNSQNDSLFKDSICRMTGLNELREQRPVLGKEQKTGIEARVSSTRTQADSYEKAFREICGDKNIDKDSPVGLLLQKRFAEKLELGSPIDDVKDGLAGYAEQLKAHHEKISADPELLFKNVCQSNKLDKENAEIFTAVMKNLQAACPNQGAGKLRFVKESMQYAASGQDMALKSTLNQEGLGEVYNNLRTKEAKIDYLTALSYAGQTMPSSIAGNLKAMRAMQPTGPLTPSTVAKVLGLDTQLQKNGVQLEQCKDMLEIQNAFYFARFSQFPEQMAEHGLKPSQTAIANGCMMIDSIGLKPDFVFSCLAHPGTTITEKDFVVNLSSGSMKSSDTPETGYAQWRKDFQRQLNKDGTGITSVTVHTSDASQMVCTNDTSGMSEYEKADFKAEKPMPRLDQTFAALKDLCTTGGVLQEKQLAKIMFSLSQAGCVSLLRTLTPATGFASANDEHSPMEYDVSRAENGDIIFKANSPKEPTNVVRLDAEYVIHPDGTSDCRSMTVTSPRQEAA